MAGNTYLIIKWGDIKTSITQLEYNKNDVEKTNTNITSANKGIFSKLSDLTSSKPFKKTMQIVSNIAPTNSQNKVSKLAVGLSNLSTGNPFSSAKMENLSLKFLNPVFSATSQSLGYNSFSELYSKIKFGGLGMTSEEAKAFTKTSAVTAEQLAVQKEYSINKKKSIVNGIVINVIDSDDESYDSEVPERKVENGYDLSAYVHNSNKKRSFKGYIAGGEFFKTNLLSGINVVNEQTSAEDMKELLVQIRDSKTTFDVEVGNEGEIKDCLFSSLSFSKSNSTLNGYEISFDIQPIYKDNIELVSANYKDTNKSSGSNKKGTSKKKGNTSNKKQNDKGKKSSKDNKVAMKDTISRQAGELILPLNFGNPFRR